MQLTSFPALVAPGSKVLILGSMPGRKSLDAAQYYAHPRNLFWSFMEELVGVNRQAPYAERVKQLRGSGVALWDVLKHCEREGSLDTDIVGSSEVPNDFEGLLAEHPTLKAIFFNGKKAQSAFSHHVSPTLSAATRDQIEFILLPSTSPANASAPRLAKLEKWRDILRFLS